MKILLSTEKNVLSWGEKKNPEINRLKILAVYQKFLF